MSDSGLLQPDMADPERGELARSGRRRVLQSMGSAAAAKATDSFCAAFVESRPPRLGLGALAMLLTPSGRALRLADLATLLTPRGRALRLADTTLSAFLAAPPGPLRTAVVEFDAGPRSVVGESRLDRVRQLRDQFDRVAGPVSAELEARAARELRWRPGLASINVSRVFTRRCWLNQTLSVQVPPAALADVAADDRVVRLDVPRPVAVAGAGASAQPVHVPAGAGGAGVIIAVVDGEVDITHDALAGRILHRSNRTREPWGAPSDHGTAVAGLAAAAGPGCTGAAPEAVVYNYKALPTNKFLGTDTACADALQDAVTDQVDVVNCSWWVLDAPDLTGRHRSALEAVVDVGVFVVKSAGNDGPAPRSISPPGDAVGALVVGASNPDGTAVLDYSSRGPLANDRPAPTCVTVGGDAGHPLFTLQVGGGTGAALWGTSLAAGIASGVAARLLAGTPDIPPPQLTETIVDRCRPIPGASASDQGAGWLAPA